MNLSSLKQIVAPNTTFNKVAFVLFLFGVISFTFFKTEGQFKLAANVISETYKNRDALIEKAINAEKGTTKEILQLKEQYVIITEIKKSYLFIARSYSSYNYSFTIFFILFSIASGVLGFLLLKKGWDNTTSYYLKASFLLVFFCSTLFGVLPKVFDNKENIKNNLIKYNYYSGLQLDVYELIKDNNGYIKDGSQESLSKLNKKISEITKGIKDNQDLYFDIHIDKVPVDAKPLE